MAKKSAGSLKIAALAALPGVMGVGLWARLIHIYNFFVYPDSYYYLLLADNLRHSGRLYGRLGPRGMRFPPIGSAIFKPVYPALVGLVDFGLNNSEMSGHIVAIGASLASIFLIYLLGARLFDSRWTGMISALLMAVSFNLIFWSGFIMGDSLSLMLLLVVLVLALRSDRPEYGNALDFAAGVSIAFLFLSRATFIVIMPGLLWLMTVEYGWQKERRLTALSSGCATLALTAVLILPPLGQFAPVAKEAAPILLSALAAVALLALGFLAARRLGFNADIAFLLLLAAPILAQAANFIMAGEAGKIFYPGLQRFVANDPLISVIGVAGLFWLYRSPNRRLSVFFALSIFLLLIVYYQVAGWEGRYLIQALPFLILPGAWAAANVLIAWPGYLRQGQTLARTGAVCGMAALLLVFGLTLQRALTPASGVLLKPSYEARVSRLARPALARYPKETVLIAALPWGYYYHLRFSTWGLDARQPGKVLRFLPKQGSFLVVMDAPLRLQFPAVAKRLAALKNAGQATSFQIAQGYSSGQLSIAGKHEVIIYELDYGRLAKALQPKRALP